MKIGKTNDELSKSQKESLSDISNINKSNIKSIVKAFLLIIANNAALANLILTILYHPKIMDIIFFIVIWFLTLNIIVALSSNLTNEKHEESKNDVSKFTTQELLLELLSRNIK